MVKVLMVGIARKKLLKITCESKNTSEMMPDWKF